MVFLRETPYNRHGCTGRTVAVRPLTATVGVVVWVGVPCYICEEKQDAPPIPPIGTIVELPDWGVVKRCWEGEIEGEDVLCSLNGEQVPLSSILTKEPLTWATAALMCGKSHNMSLIRNVFLPDGIEAGPDCTLVWPSKLVVIYRDPLRDLVEDFISHRVGFAALRRALEGVY